jgi:ankyrin repeat protein
MDRPSDDDFMAYLDAACAGDVRRVTAFLNRYPAAVDDHPWHLETTALIEAASRGKRAMVELLLKAGADVNKADSPSRTTPLMGAAECGSAEIIRVLLAHNARAGLKNARGETAADIAKRRGYKDVAEILHTAPRERHNAALERLKEKARGKNLRVKGNPRP